MLKRTLMLLALAGVFATSGAAASARPIPAGAEIRFGVRARTTVPAGAEALSPVPSGQVVPLEVVLAPSHASALKHLLHVLYQPGASEYHHWLSKGSFARRFGPSQATLTQVTSWLHRIGAVDLHRLPFAIKATVTAEDVASEMGAPLVGYRTRAGHVGYAALNRPLVPAGLAPRISAILGLNTLFRYEPTGLESGSVRSHIRSVRSISRASTVCPGAASLSNDYWTFPQEGLAYGMDALTGAGETASGKTIGLYELGSESTSDISTYWQCFGLTNAVTEETVDGGGGSNLSYTTEVNADIEQAASQAPGAALISYEGPNTIGGEYDVWNQIVSADAAQVVSESWGQCERAAANTGTIGAYTTLFKQAASQGQTVLVASGDHGSAGCVADGGGDTSEQVNYPASDAWVVAAGGTTLTAAGSEVAWNDCQSEESFSCALQGGAGGGGLSRYEPELSYQPQILYWPSAQSCGTNCREVPDVSANAGVPMIMYQAANGGWLGIEGTSLAAPFLAGLVADIDSGCAANLGAWTPALYAIAAYPDAFNDITSGDTDVTGANGGFFPAMVGYDAATGLGSPKPSGLTCAQVTSVAPASAAPGATVTLSGLGLEGAKITFGSQAATVLSATATTAQVVVPSGSGTAQVSASGIDGSGLNSATFTYKSPPAPVKCVVPKVVGKPLAAAEAAVRKAKCTVGTISGKHSSVKRGAVASERPSPGTRLAEGSRVSLVVSTGKRR